MKYVRSGLAVVIGMVAVGCASAPPPTAKLASSEAAIRTASTAGAAETPQANTYLQLSQKEFERGKALMKDGKNHDAGGSLAMSQTDAEVAAALTHESQTRAAAEQSKAALAAVRAGGAPPSAVGGGPTTQPPAARPTPTPSPYTQPGQPQQQPKQQPQPQQYQQQPQQQQPQQQPQQQQHPQPSGTEPTH